MVLWKCKECKAYLYNSPVETYLESGFRFYYQHLFVEPCWYGPNTNILCNNCDYYERKLAESKIKKGKKLIALRNPRRSQRLKNKREGLKL